MKSINYTIVIAAIAGFTAVAIGALGAHALKPLLSENQLQSFETGVKYHFYHAIVLLIIGIWCEQKRTEKLKWAANLIIAGIICFSGSIYLLSTAHLYTSSGLKFLGPITPIGGLLFMSAWVLIGLNAVSKK
jgi:uncharacterized membrane protein YgdD (TMEM256/DUF423 family)